MLKTIVRLIALVIAVLIQQFIQHGTQMRLGAVPVFLIYFSLYMISNEICKRIDD